MHVVLYFWNFFKHQNVPMYNHTAPAAKWCKERQEWYQTFGGFAFAISTPKRSVVYTTVYSSHKAALWCDLHLQFRFFVLTCIIRAQLGLPCMSNNNAGPGDICVLVEWARPRFYAILNKMDSTQSHNCLLPICDHQHLYIKNLDLLLNFPDVYAS